MKKIKITVLSIVVFLICKNFTAQVHNESWRNITKKEEGIWFASAEAKKIAENVLLFQRDIGGWPKNIQMHHAIICKRKAKNNRFKKKH